MSTKPRESGGNEAALSGPDARPDELLVAEALAGDERAFGELVFRHRSAAVRVASTIIGPNHAEDVVQEALLMALKGLGSLKDRSKFSRWLMAITRWRALRVGRREGRHAQGRMAFDDSVFETLSELASDPRQADAMDELLLVALENIPPELAEVIRYHFLHGLPHQKIADFLGVPLSTVKWRCFRGKEVLRCTLSPEPTCPTVCRKGCAKFPSAPEARAAGQ